MLERMRNRKASGFTLLELIVVLLILGVLAAVAVPTFATVRSNAAAASVETTANAIVRNANSIAASDPTALGDADMNHVRRSVLEAGFGEEDTPGTITHPGTLADNGYTYDDEDDVLTIRTGGFDCVVTFIVSGGNAETAGRPTCDRSS